MVEKISMWTATTESSNKIVAKMTAWITLAGTFINIYIKSTWDRKTIFLDHCGTGLLNILKVRNLPVSQSYTVCHYHIYSIKLSSCDRLTAWRSAVDWHPIQVCIVPSVSSISSDSTAVLTRVKQLVKIII